MTEQLQKEIDNRIATLPKEMGEVIRNSNWQNISEDIAKKYFFDEDSINSIQAEISLVLLGLEYLDDLASNMEDNAGATKNEAGKMTEEFIEKIFTPMAEKLNENIKKSLDKKNVHWQQNLDFIISGGDYTAFIRRIENQTNNSTPNNQTMSGSSKMTDLRDSFTI